MILNLSREQIKTMKKPLVSMVVSFSTFLLQMIQAILQVLEQSSSHVLDFHHYNNESILMYNFFIDSDQKDTVNYIIMQYYEFLPLVENMVFYDTVLND